MAGVWFIVTVPTQSYQQSKVLKNSASQPALITSKNSTTQLLEEASGAKFETDSVTGSLTKERKADVLIVENDDSRSMKTSPNVLRTSRSQSPVAVNQNSIAEDSTEQVLLETLKKLGVESAVWSLSKDGNIYQVTFCSKSEDCENTLQILSNVGIGSRPFTSLSVIPCTLHYDSKDAGDEVYGSSEAETSSDVETVGESKTLRSNKGLKRRTRFLQTVKSRLTVAQVVEGVRSSASLTFDFLMFIILAGSLAALGLVENSSVTLVASMLVSPMMGPILAGTFGTVVQDKALRRLGVQNELIGLSICLSFGFIFGIVYGFTPNWHENYLLTNEMVARGQLRSLWIGILIAIPSGAGVALSVLGGNAGSLVGVAISASLLPPVVNAGLLWAIALTKLIADDNNLMVPSSYNPTYSINVAVEAAILGAVSLCLTVVNIICIFIMGVIMLKVKEVAPGTGLSSTRKFWSRDVPNTRDYNKTYGATEGSKLAERFLDEWELLNEGKNSVHRISGGLDRLQRCMDDLVDDEVYRTVCQMTAYPRPNMASHVTWHRSTPADRGFPFEGSHSQPYQRSRRQYHRSLSTPSEANEVQTKRKRILSSSAAASAASPTDKNHGKRTTWGFSIPKPGKHRFVVTKTDESQHFELGEKA